MCDLTSYRTCTWNEPARNHTLALLTVFALPLPQGKPRQVGLSQARPSQATPSTLKHDTEAYTNSYTDAA